MRRYRYSRLKNLGITALLALPGMSVVNSAQAACYSTPHMAVEAFVTSSSVTPALKDGYQVTGMQSDLVLGERWATIVNCSHPEWPVFALPAPGGRSVIAPPEAQHALKDNVRKAPVVRAGDVVRMWKQERLLRI